MFMYVYTIPGHIGIDGAGDVPQEYAESHIQVRRLLTLLNTAVEQLVEVLQ